METRLREWVSAAQGEHHDWYETNRQLTIIADEAAQASAAVQAELEAGRLAAQTLASAIGTVQSVGEWRSKRGVKIDREAGHSALQEAQEALQRGDYSAAQEQASIAYQEAHDAIEDANDRVAAADRQASETHLPSNDSHDTSNWSISDSGSGISDFGGGGGDSGNGVSGW